MDESQLRKVLLADSICRKCKKHSKKALRLRCMHCKDTELCYKCFESGEHAHHEMIGLWVSPVQHKNALNRQESDPSVLHITVQCDGCDVKPIKGDRFKCIQCSDYDLCGDCHSKGVHIYSGHTLQRIVKSNAKQRVHPNIQCDGCQVHPINGIRFKCTVCQDVDFCGPCRSAGLHSEHVMATILKPTPAKEVDRQKKSGLHVHSGITCDNCGVLPIIGGAFVCLQCPDYDLCESCMTSGVHSAHALVTWEEKHLREELHASKGQRDVTWSRQPIHQGIICDNCDAFPIRGPRFKCTVCADFDLCQNCHDANAHPEHRLMQFAFGKPVKSEAGNSLDKETHVERIIHFGVTCDNCHADPIRGPRFKCTVCADFDLCQNCHDAKAHPEHRLMQFAFGKPVKSEAGDNDSKETHDERIIHVGVICDNCHANPIKGSRFKCTVCADFDLCQACHIGKAHSQHKLVEFAFGQRLEQAEPSEGTPQTLPSAPNGSNNADSSEEKLTCGICMDKEKNMVFGCGHSTCADCGQQVEKCPFCQRPVEQRINLYL